MNTNDERPGVAFVGSILILLLFVCVAGIVAACVAMVGHQDFIGGGIALLASAVAGNTVLHSLS